MSYAGAGDVCAGVARRIRRDPELTNSRRMPIPVLLKDVVEAIEPLSEEWLAYINRTTGEIVSFSSEAADAAEMSEQDDADAPDWMQEELSVAKEVLAADDYIPLPGKFDFHEYRVMERFCMSQKESGLRESLLKAIHGAGAFRRFKAAVHARGIAGSWYEYRDQALCDLAAAFLESAGIPFITE